MIVSLHGDTFHSRADSRFASSQWETALLCNDVSHWLGASPEAVLHITSPLRVEPTSHQLPMRNHIRKWSFTNGVLKARLSATPPPVRLVPDQATSKLTRFPCFSRFSWNLISPCLYQLQSQQWQGKIIIPWNTITMGKYNRIYVECHIHWYSRELDFDILYCIRHRWIGDNYYHCCFIWLSLSATFLSSLSSLSLSSLLLFLRQYYCNCYY